MIKSLKNAQIADGLPRILGEQPWVKALSMAMLELHQKTMGYIAGSQIYTAIDTVAEEVLDALAVNWKIDWYDTGYDIEQKRRIVKTALNIRRTMGLRELQERRPTRSIREQSWRNGLSTAAPTESSDCG